MFPTATMNLSLSRSESGLRSAAKRLALFSWVVRRQVVPALIARKLRQEARQLSNDVLRVTSLMRSIDDVDAEIDATGDVAKHTSWMVEQIKGLHLSAKSIEAAAGSIGSGKVLAAATDLAAVYAEYYQAVARLAWAVAEHDAAIAPRQSGFVANSPDEVGAMLDRIAIG